MVFYKSEPLDEFKQQHLEMVIPQAIYQLLQEQKLNINQGIYNVSIEFQKPINVEVEEIIDKFRVADEYRFKGVQKTRAEIEKVAKSFRYLIIKIEPKEAKENWYEWWKDNRSPEIRTTDN